ncbi:flagellum-associated coiled-coil domain-containing protein 1-like [Clupea harengus]|uniref:Flagellum-associated coiled-coil domain-containing protein 1-like n=1 Tax=Clupea harengus TaxID=7950 RepID=A0A8M1KRL1_CLUHA|nr:flagellum-associated coiled-coil domain-containing protein 1-like [Clupea harengus]
MQVILQDMQEQMGKLTALLKDERRSHQHSCRALLEEADRRAERVRQMHQLEMNQLFETHNKEIKNMLELHSKHMEEERNYAAVRYALLEKDYDFLKSSFRTYKDSIADEMRSSWLKKETSWREEQERDLLEQMMSVKKQLNQSEAEKEEQQKAFEAEIAGLNSNYKAEIKELEKELSEKDITVTLLNTALKHTQFKMDVMSLNSSENGAKKYHSRRRSIIPQLAQSKSSVE